MSHCIWATEIESKCKCSTKYECQQDQGTVTESKCLSDCHYRINPDYVARNQKISAIFPAFNEDPVKIKTTVETLNSSLLEGTILEIIVVDDVSDEPIKIDYADNVQVLRNEEPLGAMGSRNRALQLVTGDVVTMWDSHMKIDIPGTLEVMAAKSLEEHCIVNMKSRGYESGRGQGGCYIYWNSRDGFQLRWRGMKDQSKKEWDRVPCLLGANYAASRETIDIMTKPTGKFWDNIAGRWGYGERSLGVKAFLMDIPVYVCAHHPTRHYYKKSNTLNNVEGVSPTEEVWKNVAYASASIFSEKTFDLRFRDFCEKRLGKEQANTLIHKALEERNELPWSYEDEKKVFTHLCGHKSDAETYNPQFRDWLPEARTLLDDVQPKKIYVWRPSQFVVDLRERFPDAEIHCGEFKNSRRYKDWVPMLNRLNVKPIGLTKQSYAKLNEDFDLVVISGDYQEECLQNAESADQILMSGDDLRGLLDNSDRKQEEEIVGIQTANDSEEPTDETPARGGPTAFDWKELTAKYTEKKQSVLAWVNGSKAANILISLKPAELKIISHKNLSLPDAVEVDHIPIDADATSLYAVKPYIDNPTKLWDVIFIDGRRRIECLVTAKKLVKDDGYVIIHDAQRKAYLPGIELLDMVESDDRGRTLVLRTT